jgi:hypothetical protein
MKSTSKLDTAKTSTTLLLIVVDFLLFYLTAIGGAFAKIISQTLLFIIPFLATVTIVIPFLLFGLFSIFMAFIYMAAKNNRVIFFGLISFILFLPAAMSTPSINWLEKTNIPNLQAFIVTVITGFTVFSCLIILNGTTRLSKTLQELNKRGVQNAEVQTVIDAEISITTKIVAGSVALSAAAVGLYVAGQPLVSQIASSSFTYVPFILGIAAVVTASVLIYYFLIRRDSS